MTSDSDVDRDEKAGIHVGNYGSVLVIGGGISGIQSALDLAEVGFKVYIVEHGMSIGGVMAQLDKTFPTNDCAMCILGPKLVGTARHRNIEIITNSEVSGVSGDVGNFEVKIKKHPRFVDADRCNGCGDCVEHCPVDILSDFDADLGYRKAIFQPFPQAVPNIFAIDKDTGTSPCKIACPAGLNAQGFIALASKEKFAEALSLIRERVPLPGTLGRICYHPCEGECNRAEIDEPVAIRNIRRAITDYIYDHPGELEDYLKEREVRLKDRETHLEEREEHLKDREAYLEEGGLLDEPKGEGGKVAIIGSGPAGLTAASDLSRKGYHPTIFEREKKSGGMLHYGIPGYRLPKDYLEMEVDRLAREDEIEIRNGLCYGKDFILKDLEKEGYRAVFLATGANRSKSLNLEGIEARGVLLGVSFLKDINTGMLKPGTLDNEEIVVIGGGNVAVDVARSSLRLGAKKVHMACLEDRSEMPAHDWEVEQVLEEGVELHTRLGPREIKVRNNAVEGIVFSKCLRVFDENGRFNPSFDLECTSELKGDKVILAIGQEPETEFMEEDGIELLPGGWIKVDRLTLQTSIPYVFAGGETATGPASAVETIGSGHEAAESIDRFLRGEDLREGRGGDDPEAAGIPDKAPRCRKERNEPEIVQPGKRIGSFLEIEKGFTMEQLLAESRRCLNCSGCSECLQCVEYCGREAIDHGMVEEEETLNVGAIIVSPGFDEFDPSIKDEYGYDRFPNVLSSIEFERMLSASGPYKGHITRISDGKAPGKVAWLQCVGSRDESCDRPYCSSVCCMYATKEAVIAKEHQSGLDTHIYFMDMRSFGKDFDRYFERAKNEYGVVYRRCRIPRIEQDRETKDLLIQYIDSDGTMREDRYDMVVLSVGLQPCGALGDLSQVLDINLNRYGFVETDAFNQVATTRPGVFASGSVTEPKDIPESVIQASAAAGEASGDLFDVRGTLVEEKSYPQERDISREEPRIGVVVCHCGINIGGVIDVKSVVEEAKGLPYVEFAQETLYTCSQDSLEVIKEKIKEFGLNRLVIASCTPRTHEPLFQDTMKEADLNPHLFEMANIRDQNSWVHKGEPELATRKAFDAVRMAVSKAALLYPIQHHRTEVIPNALVIGGGIAGMTAALSIADQGFKVFLVEREEVLGGHLREIFIGMGNEDPKLLLKNSIERIEAHPDIEVFTSTTVDDVSGYVGNFSTKLIPRDGRGVSEEHNVSERHNASEEREVREVKHGAIVVATGARAYEPTEYCYGKSKDILTQIELEKELFDGGDALKELEEVVMVQCVGSRNEERPYCSRICCSRALKNALMLRELNPDVSIYILYRDIRTYGFREDTLYREARKQGILFIRYEEGEEPEVKVEGKQITVETEDKILHRRIRFHPDRLVLSTGVVPGDNWELAQMLKVPLNEDRFFLEAHVKLRPVEFSADGIYLCGLAHSPRFIEESILQAKAAGAKAVTVLSKDHLETKGNIASIKTRNCAGCKLCISVCPYDAIDFDDERGVAVVNEILCQGCGACAAICPSGVSQQNTFTKRQIFSMIESCLE